MVDILGRITKYRMDRGWSEYTLAEKSGVPQSTISSWYRKNSTPSIQSLEKICDAFGITIIILFMEEDSKLVDVTPEDRYLLQQWHCLTEEKKKALLAFINYFK